METLRISNHTMRDWTGYAARFGFVPDPMIIRAGEIFMNGRIVAAQLGRDEFSVWGALQENIGGIVDFFDMIVTREQIPLINYRNTFDFLAGDMPIQMFPSEKSFCEVEIGDEVYFRIKQGALTDLAALNLEQVDAAVLPPVMREMDAFRYDWKPSFDVLGNDPDLGPARDKLARLSGLNRELAHFMLGGLIFSGFAQASGTTHYVQPKRSRYYLALSMAREASIGLSAQHETAIFNMAEAKLNGSVAETWRSQPIPPVLPYLVAVTPPPLTARKLVDAALEFRESRAGSAYIAAVKTHRADGIAARRIEDAAAVEHQRAFEMLAPYSRIDPEKSGSLEVKLSSELIGHPGAEVKTSIRVPTWLKVWWNDHVPFGGMRKTMRRMWMAADGYDDLSRKLREAWSAS